MSNPDSHDQYVRRVDDDFDDSGSAPSGSKRYRDGSPTPESRAASSSPDPGTFDAAPPPGPPSLGAGTTVSTLGSSWSRVPEGRGRDDVDTDVVENLLAAARLREAGELASASMPGHKADSRQHEGPGVSGGGEASTEDDLDRFLSAQFLTAEDIGLAQAARTAAVSGASEPGASLNILIAILFPCSLPFAELIL